MQPLFLEYQRVALQLGDHPIAGDEVPFKDLLRQRIFDLRLDGALQRTRSIHRIVASLADLVAPIIVQAQRDVALRQPLPQSSELYIDDGSNVLTPQRGKYHD